MVMQQTRYLSYGRNQVLWAQKRSNCLVCPHRAEEWCGLNDDIAVLNEAKSTNTYHVGQVIFYQGNPCLGLYCIEEGTVALRKCDRQGNEVIVRLVHAGETLGMRTFFAESEYSASAVAQTSCRICFIDSSVAKQLLARNPLVNNAFLKKIASALREAEEDKLHFATLSVRARLAHLLLDLKDRYGEMGDNYVLHIHLPLSRQDIASMIATRPETLSRTIKAMEQEGVAKFYKRMVQIPDLDILMDEIDTIGI